MRTSDTKDILATGSITRYVARCVSNLRLNSD